MHASSIQDGGKTVYWGLGSTDVDTDVSPDIIMSRQNHNSAHCPTLGHHWEEDRNRGAVLVLFRGLMLSLNLFCNVVDVQCPFSSSTLIFTREPTYMGMTMYWCFV